MKARWARLGAVVLVAGALGLPAAVARAQGTSDGADFCGLLENGQLHVASGVLDHGAEVSFTTEGDVAAVQQQVQVLAERANASYWDNVSLEPEAGEWALTIPPGMAEAIPTTDGATLQLMHTSALGTAVIRAWRMRLDKLLTEGDCARLVQAPGEV